MNHTLLSSRLVHAKKSRALKPTLIALYVATSAVTYGFRAGRRHNLSILEILLRKLRKPSEMPLLNFSIAFLGWSSFLFAYPLIELVAAVFRLSAFYYYYPNSRGAGLIFVPAGQSSALDLRKLSHRLDWGMVQVKIPLVCNDGGSGSYEQITLNLPHLNSPKHGLKAWPWKSHPWLVELLLLRPLRRHLDSMRSRCFKMESVAAVDKDVNENGSGKMLTLKSSDQVIVVDDNRTLQLFKRMYLRAMKSLDEKRSVCIAMDAEWGSASPVSLVQLAIAIEEDQPTSIFILDVLRLRLDEEILMQCRALLLPALSTERRHRVLTFSPHNDKVRLIAAGILPDSLEHESLSSMGWLDLQSMPWGLGDSPGLHKIVRHCFGVKLDKRMQTANWDVRPLSDKQIKYAALDAACLLRLYSVAPT